MSKFLKRYIRVTDRYEGFHRYEDAPDQVAFLRESHRHMFHVEATIEVFHDDRELEFFMVKDVLKHQIVPFVSLSGNLGSCEQQAERILTGLKNTYGDKRYMKVEVAEDGENGGIVEWNPHTLTSRAPGFWENDSRKVYREVVKRNTLGS